MSTTVLVTGSAGHLGEGLMRTLPGAGYGAIGLDLRRTAFTHHVGSITDRALVDRCMAGVDAVVHTATLHKPHVATHRRQDFVDVNVTGTLNLLTDPPGLTVMIDGREHPQKTPVNVTLPVGPHRIQVVKGTERQELQVDLSDGQFVSKTISWQ